MSWSVESDFARIGARAEIVLVAEEGHDADLAGTPPVRVLALNDAAGPCFRVERRWCVTANVAHVDVAGRCLLLIADHFRYGPRRYSRFLCGCDAAGGAPYVAPLPAGARPWNVWQAQDVLSAATASADELVAIH